MKTISAVLVMLMLSGCAGMQQVRPNERYFIGEFGGRVVYEFEYVHGDWCAMALDSLSLWNRIATRCSPIKTDRALSAVMHASEEVSGEITMKFFSMDACWRFRESAVNAPGLTLGQCALIGSVK